jgi:hypothetical protein
MTLFILAGEESLVHFELVPGSGIDTAEELREKLLWVACYFPIFKKENDTPLI